MRNRNKAYTMIEVILTIIIITILALVIFPKYLDLKQKSQESAENYIVSSVQSALATYSATQGMKQ